MSFVAMVMAVLSGITIGTQENEFMRIHGVDLSAVAAGSGRWKNGINFNIFACEEVRALKPPILKDQPGQSSEGSTHVQSTWHRTARCGTHRQGSP